MISKTTRSAGMPRSHSGWVTVLATLLAACLLSSPGRAEAQAGRSQVNEGNRLYQEGRFEEAHEKYLEALRENPELPLIRFNDGNALYQGQDFESARQAYEQALASGDPALASSAWYNLGNALFRAQQLEPSLEAYKQALRLNPADQDAKHNLERVLEQMQEQEQQEQQQDQQQDQQGEQQQDQQQPQPEQPQGGEPDQPQEPEQPEGADQPDDPSEQQEGQNEPEPGEMTREEAERLLDAFSEDPGDVNRKPFLPERARRPLKDW